MNPLDRERRFFNHLFQEFESIFSGPPGIQRHDFVPSTVVNGCELMQPWGYLAGVHLNPIPWNGAFIAFVTIFPPSWERLDLISPAPCGW
jgi:hypothetical protein